MSAAAIFALRRKRLVRRFHERGATDPAPANALELVGAQSSSVLARSIRTGAIQPEPDVGCLLKQGPKTIAVLRPDPGAGAGSGPNRSRAWLE